MSNKKKTKARASKPLHKKVVKPKLAKKARIHVHRAQKRVNQIRIRKISRHIAPKTRIVAVKPVKEPQRRKIDVIPVIANIADIAVIQDAISDTDFSNHIARSIGKRARDIILLLADPQTDDIIAEKLSIKINEVRRMLNMLNTYGVARYNVNKDSKGWLTFKWYIDSNKLLEMRKDIVAQNAKSAYKIPEGCNDFFLCDKCYGGQNTVFPFETAFEMGFKCDCGTAMKRVSKEDLAQLVVAQESKVL